MKEDVSYEADQAELLRLTTQAWETKDGQAPVTKHDVSSDFV